MKRIINKYITSVVMFIIVLIMVSCEGIPTASITAPTINIYDNVVSWSKVNQIDEYIIYVNDTVIITTTDTTYTLDYNEVGEYQVQVASVSYDNENNMVVSKSNKAVYTVKQLADPVISIKEDTISWPKVLNAVHYIIYLNGTYLDTIEELTYTLNDVKAGTYQISIEAISDYKMFLNSNLSNEVTYIKKDSVEPIDNQINIVMVNDVHGILNDETKGMDRLASIYKTLEADGDDYIKIANGDMFQGGYTTSILHGLPMIDVLNTMDFDAFVIGNHEFDWGLETIAKYKDGDLTNGEAKFPFLGANIVYKGTTTMVDWLTPYTIVQDNDNKVGIIGLMGYGLESSILTDMVKDYEFLNPVPIAQKLAKELRTNESCNVVVVAIHDYDEYTNNKLAELTGDAKIDAIFCGHTHTNNNTKIERSNNVALPIVQTGSYNYMTYEISFLLENKNVASYKVNNYYCSDYQKDEIVEAVINKYQETIDEGNRILGMTNVDLSKNELGNYAVEAMKELYKVDVAIMNTGGVRSVIKKGSITVAEVFEAFPFNNMVITTTISKEDLQDFYYTNGSYMYFDKAFSTTIQNGKATYEIAIIDYVYTSTRYTQFDNCIAHETNQILRDIVIKYIDELY